MKLEDTGRGVERVTLMYHCQEYDQNDPLDGGVSASASKMCVFFEPIISIPGIYSTILLAKSISHTHTHTHTHSLLKHRL